MGDDDVDGAGVGGPPFVDCSAVVEELYTFLDGELTENRRVQFTSHMHGCVDCHEVMEFHAELKLVISQKCRESVPDELRLRIARALGLPDATGNTPS